MFRYLMPACTHGKVKMRCVTAFYMLAGVARG